MEDIARKIRALCVDLHGLDKKGKIVIFPQHRHGGVEQQRNFGVDLTSKKSE